MVSRMLATNDTMMVKRKNHQNSERRARPLKSAYLLRQILTASWNDIGTSGVSDVGGRWPLRVGGYRDRAPYAATRSCLLPHRQGVAGRVGEVEAAATGELERPLVDRAARRPNGSQGGVEVVAVEDHQGQPRARR